MRTPILTLLCLLVLVPCNVQAACEPNIPADVSGDCKVDFNDFAIIASDWLESGSAEPNQKWVARYNGPGNGSDVAYAIAIDSNDNIFVTGRSYDPGTNYDYATVKYSPDSNLPLWVARYNGSGNGSDVAYAMAIDSNDNIYVAGRSTGSDTNYDYVTVKYPPDSNQPVWVARYNGPGNYIDLAYAIAIDSNDNIYVTGYSSGSGTSYDYTTVKYSADSNLPVWVARYNGPGDGSDVAYAVALDSNDNIYVTGRSHGSGTNYDYATVKYSPDGNLPVWVARYNGPHNSGDDAYAIAIDSNDNIYVTGRSIGSGTNYDYATVKYSADSNLPVWVARYNGLGNGIDQAEAIAVDSSDYIYVTGESAGSGTSSDYATVKYLPDSNLPVWVARYNGPGNGSDVAYAIAIDSNDYIYVTGFSFSGTEYDYATIRYSPDSNRLVWVATYNGPGFDIDQAQAIAVDSSDYIYVTGESAGSGTSSDYATIKYSPNYTCAPQITGDLTHDCQVDIYDLRAFCDHWLECNLDPPQHCWQ